MVEAALSDSYSRAENAARSIRSRIAVDAKIAVVLGSGLGAFADDFEGAVALPYREIPGFVSSTAEGHVGSLVAGKVEGVPVLAMQGRVHYYEGYSLEEVTFPIRTFKLLGINTLILTNAAGGVDVQLTRGALMVISDHLNLMGVNPLRGKNDDRFGPRFPDMTEVYDREFQQIAEEEASSLSHERYEKGLDAEQTDFLHRGIYCGLPGPTYETPAEIRMYRFLGADAVGMSTVPEAIAARHMGLRVLGISCITNLAAGMSGEVIEHGHVMETGARIAEVFKELLRRVVVRIN